MLVTVSHGCRPYLMRRLGIVGKEVPDHIWIFQMCFRITLLRMNEHLKLDDKMAGQGWQSHFRGRERRTYEEWITNKKDRCIVANHIPKT